MERHVCLFIDFASHARRRRRPRLFLLPQSVTVGSHTRFFKFIKFDYLPSMLG